MSVSRLLDDLSHLTGAHLSAKDEAKAEIVLVDVKGVSLGTLMDKVATVTSCEWEHSGDKYTLEPDRKAWKREESEELEMKASKVRGAIKEKLTYFAGLEKEEQEYLKNVKAPDGDDVYGELWLGSWHEKHRDYDPADIATIRLLSLFDPAFLATLPINRKLVWVSNNANSFQGELPDGWEPAVRDMMVDTDRLGVAQHAEIQDFLRSGRKLSKDSASDELLDLIRKNDQNWVDHPAQPIAKSLLTVMRAKDGIHASLNSYDAGGENVSYSPSLYCLLPASDSPANTGHGPLVDPAKIHLSSDAAQVRKMLLGIASPGSALRRLTPELRKRFADVQTSDPLSFIASDVIEGYRSSQGDQIVAAVPDDLYGISLDWLEIPNPPIDAPPDPKAIRLGDVLKVTRDGTYLLLTPVRPAENRNNRLQRSEIGSLLSNAGNNGCPSLAELSIYAETLPPFDESPIAASYENLFWPNTIFFDSNQAWPSLRLLNSLGSDQWVTLKSGKQLPFAKLSDDQRRQVALTVLSQDEVLVDKALNEEEPDPNAPHLLSDERTEWLPNAMARGYVTLKIRSQPIVFFDSDQSDYFRRGMAGSAWARFRWREKHDKGAFRYAVPNEGKIGRLDSYQLGFHLGPHLAVTLDLLDYAMPSDAPLLSEDQFPAAFLAAGKAALKRMERSSQTTSGFPGLGGTPGPSP